MNVKDAIAARLSIRQYEEASIPDEHLEILFKSLQLAPSASNSQNWEFVFIGNPELRDELRPACDFQDFVPQCSYLIVGIVEPIGKWHTVDVTIAMTNLTLQATELGYGTCWIGAFNEAAVKAALDIPERKKVVACMALGKAKGAHVPNTRKAIETFVFLDGYAKPFKR
jgi:nitroreductase